MIIYAYEEKLFAEHVVRTWSRMVSNAMKLRYHHVAFSVYNLKKSAKWYQDKLGFKIHHSYDKDGMQFVLLHYGSVKLELFHFRKDMLPLPNHNKELMSDLHVIGTKHLCLEVDNLDEMVKRLKEKGVEFTTAIDTAAFGGKYTFFKDCNGILIELYQA